MVGVVSQTLGTVVMDTENPAMLEVDVPPAHGYDPRQQTEVVAVP